MAVLAMVRRLLALVAVFGLPAGVALADGDPTTAEKRVALVIGNSSYQSVARLPNPVNDAAAVAALLQKVGFDRVEVHRDLGVNDLRRAVRDFADIVPGAEIATIFYAGHGIEVNGTNYLIPVDARLARDFDVEDETISLDRLLQAIGPAKRLRLVMVDACRDNPFLKTMRSSVGTRSVSRGLARIEPTISDTLIAFAAKAGSVAVDGDGPNSPFTSALVKHLVTPGLDLRVAFGRVRDDVLNRTRRKQEPFLYGSVGGGTVSLLPAVADPVPGPAPADPEAAVRRDYETAERAGTRGAWDAFLQRHPSGFFAELARAQRDKLAAIDPKPEPPRVTAPPVSRPQTTATPPATTPRIGYALLPATTWKVQAAFSAVQLQTTTLASVSERVKKLSAGKIELDVLPVGSVGPASHTLDLVHAATITTLDAGYVPGDVLYGKDRAFALMASIPYAFTPREHVAFRQRPEVRAAFDRMIGEVLKLNVVSFPCGTFGRNGDLWANRPLQTAEDFRGLRPNVLSLTSDIYRELGASVVPMPAFTIAPTMKQGEIDSFQFGSPASADQARVSSLAKFYYYPSSVNPAATIDLQVNKDKWNALPPVGREIIEVACREATEAMLTAHEELDRAALARFTAGGVTVAPYPAAVERALYAASQKVLARYADTNETFRAVMAIVDLMRASTLAAKMR